jgi:hypothetical protein
MFQVLQERVIVDKTRKLCFYEKVCLKRAKKSAEESWTGVKSGLWRLVGVFQVAECFGPS